MQEFTWVTPSPTDPVAYGLQIDLQKIAAALRFTLDVKQVVIRQDFDKRWKYRYLDEYCELVSREQARKVHKEIAFRGFRVSSLEVVLTPEGKILYEVEPW